VLISIITPAFNERENLLALHDRLAAVMAPEQVDWEWIIVDDHSRDDTFAAIEALAARNPRVRGLRLARNSGSHVAISCGLRHAAGDAAALLAADQEDPPEVLARMLDRWRRGAQVVWAVRRRLNGAAYHRAFAFLYWWTMRHLVGFKEVHPTGADCFLIDRIVIDAFCRSSEHNVSVFALLTWLGFRQESVEYEKQPRTIGRSGWTIARKVKLVVDSVVGFSSLPIRWCFYGGAALMALGFLLMVGGLLTLPTLGAVVMLLAAIVIGLAGLQLTALAVVGQYVWRALDDARGRPVYSIEAVAGQHPAPRPLAAGEPYARTHVGVRAE
jgi:dolichol-phosphate mannosyltransferase